MNNRNSKSKTKPMGIGIMVVALLAITSFVIADTIATQVLIDELTKTPRPYWGYDKNGRVERIGNGPNGNVKLDTTPPELIPMPPIVSLQLS